MVAKEHDDDMLVYMRELVEEPRKVGLGLVHDAQVLAHSINRFTVYFNLIVWIRIQQS